MTVPNGDPKREVIIVPTPSATMLSVMGYASPEQWNGPEACEGGGSNGAPAFLPCTGRLFSLTFPGKII